MKKGMNAVITTFCNTMFIVGVFNFANLIIGKVTQEWGTTVAINLFIIILFSLIIVLQNKTKAD